MITDLSQIRTVIQKMLSSQIPPLRIRHDSPDNFEVCGQKEVLQGKQKVDGFYFASVVPKPKDVRLYFFPIYTHANSMPQLSDELKKMLKGKSCFHIKKLNQELINEIELLINTGIQLYQTDDLI